MPASSEGEYTFLALSSDAAGYSVIHMRPSG